MTITLDHSLLDPLHYAAPELFGACSECNTPQCTERHGRLEVGGKTMETDVYAFGCLYYAVSLLSIDPSARITRPVQIFFNSVPYAGQRPHRIFVLVVRLRTT